MFTVNFKNLKMSEKVDFVAVKNYANPCEHSEEILGHNTNILQKKC